MVREAGAGSYVDVEIHHRGRVISLVKPPILLFELKILEFSRYLFTFKNRAIHGFIVNTHFRNVYLVSTRTAVLLPGRAS